MPIGTPVVTRIAPSPTGYLHLGTARTALFNFLYAKHRGGSFIVRIEDTDLARSTKEFEQDIVEGLEWLSLKADALYRQSERRALYTEELARLIASNHAYVSREPRTDDPTKEVEVVRLRNSGTVITFHDEVHGDISFDTTELHDFVIARSPTEALYHFAVVVDDEKMGVTHCLRGEDHISNTPRQILIQEALGYSRPIYAHIPLILASDRSKLSKRHGAVSLLDYRKQGFLPEAIVNYLALLGWSSKDTRELFSLDELIQEFDLPSLHRSGAVFDIEKLRWFNRHYIKALPHETLLSRVEDAIPSSVKGLPGYRRDMLEKILPILTERLGTMSDIASMAERGSLQYYFERPTIDRARLSWKDDEGAVTRRYLDEVMARLEAISPQQFNKELIKETLWNYATKQGRGSVLWPMRYALSGATESPDPFTLAEVLGKEETVARLKAASATIG